MPPLSCYSNKNIKNDVRIATVHYQPFPGQGDCGTEDVTEVLSVLESRVAPQFQVSRGVT